MYCIHGNDFMRQSCAAGRLCMVQLIFFIASRNHVLPVSGQKTNLRKPKEVSTRETTYMHLCVRYSNCHYTGNNIFNNSLPIFSNASVGLHGGGPEWRVRWFILPKKWTAQSDIRYSLEIKTYCDNTLCVIVKKNYLGWQQGLSSFLLFVPITLVELVPHPLDNALHAVRDHDV